MRESIGSSNESIKAPAAGDKIFSSKPKWIFKKITVEFKRRCLKQEITTFNHRNVFNLFVVYELETWSKI